MANKEEASGLSFIVFIPILICIAAIFILLEIRQQQRNPTAPGMGETILYKKKLTPSY
jgi:hypothetical protein